MSQSESQKTQIDKVADDVVVIFHYCVTDENGKVIDDSFADEPIAYLHGAGGIVEGLHREMEGKSVGDRFNVVVPPELAYGVPSEHEALVIGRDQLPDGFPLEPGTPIHAEIEQVEGDEGQMVVLHLVDHDDDNVYFSLDHPLAGVTLHFEVEVVGLREPTKEELEHGHPHGIHGDEPHHHH